MRNAFPVLAILAIAGVIFAGIALAQQAVHEVEGTPKSVLIPMPVYDSNKVTDISGEIIAVDDVSGPRGFFHGVVLEIKVNADTLRVLLGPERYLDKQNLKLKSGDTVVVRGSRVTLDHAIYMVAAQVKRGNETLALRSENGTPRWRRGL
jgi:hypothetical protein